MQQQKEPVQPVRVLLLVSQDVVDDLLRRHEALVALGCPVAIGAAAGGLVGTLVGMGIPEFEAKRYESKIREGRILISVHAENSDETKRAKEIFERAQAEDISSAGEESVKGKDKREHYRRAA